MAAIHPERWLKPTPQGLFCIPGDFYIDPSQPVSRAIVTHGHGDHARAGHDTVLATAETVAIMKTRYGEQFAPQAMAQPYGITVKVGDVAVRLLPAGHILGSAQIVLEYGGARAIISGDYKRRRDPTCPAFEPMSCDVFVTEATFGLPVFRHPDDGHEIERLLHSLSIHPERCHLIGVYALGKCQRLISRLRECGYDRPLYLHGALVALTQLYRSLGVDPGRFATIAGMVPSQLKGQIVLCPPSAITDRWSRRAGDVLPAMASGWMQIRARARQRGAELPLVISDHADWDELMQTFVDVAAPEIWVTHGQEDALIHALTSKGYTARALSLLGRDEEEA